MQLPDVNLLIYAHRAEPPEHERYAEWLIEMAHGPEPFALSELGASGFVEHGCEFITADADFGRFPGLRQRHPLA